MLETLARRLVRHRKLVLITWVVLIAGMIGLGTTFAGESDTDFSNPGTESQEAADLLTDAGMASDPLATGQLVIATDPAIDGGVRNHDVETLVNELLADVAAEVPDGSVDSPYSQDAHGNISADGTVAFADIDLGDGNDTELAERASAITELRDDFDAPGVTLELAGDRFVEQAPGGAAEGVGMLLAIVILLIAFGSVIAAGLPIITALFGVGVGAAIVMLASNVVSMPDFAISLTFMLGIGVGIDYALLNVTRFRTSLAEGLAVEDAVARTMNTAGRSVLFAGCTVAIAISGLLIMGGATGISMVIAAGAGVLMVMLASLTLLPAVLGMIGHRIDKFGLPHRKKRDRSHPESATPNDAQTGLAYRWSRFIQRRPWPAAIVGAAILIAMAAPALDLRLGFGDAGNRSETDTTRQAYDTLAEGFGPGANGPLLLVTELPAGDQDLAAVESLAADVASTPGVADVSPPMQVGDGSVAIVRVVPETGPQDEATNQLVHTLRDDVIPQAMAGTEVETLVTGATAGGIDFADMTFGRMPVLVGAVLLASFILLGLVFRSVVVPFKAIIANLLSLGAAFGVIVAVFQWGWGMELIGVGKTGPTEAWVPMTMFAIAYGLSMDYEVFLLSRIREEYLRSRDNAQAVADGLAKTARVITAAAAILVCVCGSFVLFDDRGLKTMGLGLAAAIFVDATVVRMLLIPAVMELLGDRNWYWPRALRRVPSFDVEPSRVPERRPEPAPVNA